MIKNADGTKMLAKTWRKLVYVTWVFMGPVWTLTFLRFSAAEC